MPIRVGERRSPGTWRDFPRFINKSATALLQFRESGSHTVRSDHYFSSARKRSLRPPKIPVQHEGNAAGCEKGETSQPVLQIESRLISIERDGFRQVRDSQHNKIDVRAHLASVSSHKKAQNSQERS